MIAGLLLALAGAALINLGFLLQHRGLHHGAGGGALGRQLLRAVRDPAWLGGQALGWIGFCSQIVAVAVAPLSLVQAFAAGGLALSIPLAAGLFGHRVTRRQAAAVLVIAGALAALPIGMPPAHDRLAAGSLGLAVAAGAVVAAGVAAGAARIPAAAARAVAAGILYGLADAAIKAVSVGWRLHGAGALVSVWTAVAAAATFGGFLAFQAALRGEGAVSPISLMTGLTTIVAVACGVLAFGESMGAGAGATAGHLVAIAVVLAGVPVLAAAQTAIVQPGEPGQARPAGGKPLTAAHGPG